MIASSLVAASIRATVVARASGLNGAYTSYDVMLMQSIDEGVAREIIAQTLASWEAHPEGEFEIELPDLSGLDPGLAPSCPGCREMLPLDSRIEHCPSCEASVDVAALLVFHHGPEVLDILRSEPDETSDAIEQTVPQGLVYPAPREVPRVRSGERDAGGGIVPVCPACGGRLAGGNSVRQTSRCEGCGRHFRSSVTN